MSNTRKAVRSVDRGFRTITLDPSKDLATRAREMSRQPSSMYVATKRVKSAMKDSYRASTKEG